MLGRIVLTLLFFWLSKNAFVAIVGFYLGLQVDRWFKRISVFVKPVDQKTVDSIKSEFLPFLFRGLGYLAKSDGRISEIEISHVEQLMNRYGFDVTVRAQAISWFKEGANERENFSFRLQEFAAIVANRPDIKKLMLELLIGLAVADGALHQQEEQALLTIAKAFGFNEAVFKLLLGQWRGQTGFGESKQDTLKDAYQVLGVKETDDFSVIKKAYRRLMSEHHPDKLIAQGVPEEAIKMATEKSQMIQAAYEKIKKQQEKSH